MTSWLGGSPPSVSGRGRPGDRARVGASIRPAGASRASTASRANVTVTACPRSGGAKVGLLNVSSEIAFSPNRTRMRTMGPRKLASSTMPRIRLPPAVPSPIDTVSGRSATERRSPARVRSRPRAATIS